mgnify:CR=1 FL=1
MAATLNASASHLPLPVPAILGHSEAHGVVELEDLGDVTLQAHLETATSGERASRYREAVAVLAVSVADVVRVNMHFLDNPDLSGVFNLGTGRAETFNAVASAVINSCRAKDGLSEMSLVDLHKAGHVRYREFPEALKGKYQHFTQADVTSLRRVGYDRMFLSVKEGVSSYVAGMLALS